MAKRHKKYGDENIKSKTKYIYKYSKMGKLKSQKYHLF